MLTIFTIPKAFKGHIDVIQRNAIQSWTMLRPKPEVILFGDDPGTSGVAEELGVIHVPKVAVNKYGTPLLNDIFEKAQRLAANDLLCYLNADIILMSDFLETVERARQEPRFLMIGQRTNVRVTDRIDFEQPEWERDLREYARQGGILESKAGIDYFVFTRHLYTEIPPFAVGRMAWDNWLVYHARASLVLVIDATEVATVVHQNHGYAHGQKAEDVREGPEARMNQELLGGPDYAFDIREATRRLTARGLQRQKWTRLLLMQRLARFPESRPSLGSWLKPARSFYRYVYRLHSGKE